MKHFVDKKVSKPRQRLVDLLILPGLEEIWAKSEEIWAELR